MTPGSGGDGRFSSHRRTHQSLKVLAVDARSDMAVDRGVDAHLQKPARLPAGDTRSTDHGWHRVMAKMDRKLLRVVALM